MHFVSVMSMRRRMGILVQYLSFLLCIDVSIQHSLQKLNRNPLGASNEQQKYQQTWGEDIRCVGMRTTYVGYTEKKKAEKAISK